MSELSREVRVLNCVAELVESSVNHLVCCFGEDNGGFVSGVLPKDIIEKKYFFILLLEIFSPVNSEMVPAKEEDDNLLTLVQKIARKPCLNANENDSNRMYRRASEFLEWLNHEFEYSIYSQEIGKNVDLSITRRDALYLVGNRCKHTLVRSNRILGKLVKKYRDSGIEASVDEEALVLTDIDNWFFDDFCGYHFTKLCELCSNLYHSIIEYVRPVYESRSTINNDMRTGYVVPSELTRSDYKSEFYSLLSRVSNPWIPVIKTPEILAQRY